MTSFPTDESTVFAAANIHWSKLRLARINAALDSLQALRRSMMASHVQNIECKEVYLLDLRRQQELLQSDARHLTIVTSRREANTGGLQWNTYMERLVHYRHIGRMISQVNYSSRIFDLSL